MAGGKEKLESVSATTDPGAPGHCEGIRFRNRFGRVQLCFTVTALFHSIPNLRVPQSAVALAQPSCSLSLPVRNYDLAATLSSGQALSLETLNNGFLGWRDRRPMRAAPLSG